MFAKVAYIASWLKVLKADSRAVFSAAAFAQEAVDWLAATTIIDSGAAKAPVERGDAALPKEVLGPFAFARGVLSRG